MNENPNIPATNKPGKPPGTLYGLGVLESMILNFITVGNNHKYGKKNTKKLNDKIVQKASLALSPNAKFNTIKPCCDYTH